MKAELFQKNILVESVHLDELDHVNNVVYLQWVQEIAKEHWQSKNAVALDADYYWVVLDHYLQYKAQAFLGDEINMQTFIEKNEGVKSTRIVEFYKQEKLLVQATTRWVLINRKNNRPARIPKEVQDIFGSSSP